MQDGSEIFNAAGEKRAVHVDTISRDDLEKGSNHALFISDL